MSGRKTTELNPSTNGEVATLPRSSQDGEVLRFVNISEDFSIFLKGHSGKKWELPPHSELSVVFDGEKWNRVNSEENREENYKECPHKSKSSSSSESSESSSSESRDDDCEKDK